MMCNPNSRGKALPRESLRNGRSIMAGSHLPVPHSRRSLFLILILNVDALKAHEINLRAAARAPQLDKLALGLALYFEGHTALVRLLNELGDLFTKLLPVEVANLLDSVRRFKLTDDKM